MKSMREKILDAIRDDFLAVAPPPNFNDPDYVPAASDWPLKFSTVELGPLDDGDQKRRYSLGIVAGPEKERHTFPYIECNWEIAIEFRITVNQGDPKPAIMGERVLTVVKRVVTNNPSWGGLAVDTKRTRNELDLSTYGDKTVAGVQFIEVMYRHSHLDPRNPYPDV